MISALLSTVAVPWWSVLVVMIWAGANLIFLQQCVYARRDAEAQVRDLRARLMQMGEELRIHREDVALDTRPAERWTA